MSHIGMLTTRSRLSMGTKVRVRSGITDPNFRHMYLDGWTGVINQIDDNSAAPYLVYWDENTLVNADPLQLTLSESDDLAFEQMWLAEADLLVTLE